MGHCDLHYGHTSVILTYYLKLSYLFYILYSRRKAVLLDSEIKVTMIFIWRWIICYTYFSAQSCFCFEAKLRVILIHYPELTCPYIGFKISDKSLDNEWSVTLPSHRFDVKQKVKLNQCPKLSCSIYKISLKVLGSYHWTIRLRLLGST